MAPSGWAFALKIMGSQGGKQEGQMGESYRSFWLLCGPRETEAWAAEWRRVHGGAQGAVWEGGIDGAGGGGRMAESGPGP